MKRMKSFVAVFVLLGPVAGLFAADLNPDLLAGMSARSIGPAGMSGRVAAIAAVESDPDTVYVGAASGGLWKSRNGGLTWKPIFDDQPLASIGAIAIFQAHPDILWVGTGEANTRNSVSVGNGVYKSLDGGQTWIHLGLENTERIHRIVLHPTNPDIAYVAAPGRLWGDDPERGVFKTEDGGKTWRKVLYVDERTGGADLAMDPSNPNKLFASMWQFRRWPYFFRSGGPSSGLYVSFDAGETWKRYQQEDGLPSGDLGRIAVAIAPSDPSVVYALVEADKSALLRSSDGGKSWKSVNTRFDIAPRPFYFADLRVDPRWPNRVYNIGFSLNVSDDGGKTFDELIPGSQVHGDYHAMWLDPKNAEHLYVGDDGGMSVSRDGGKSSAFVTNLPLGQFYHIALDMDVPYHVYGGLQDNASWRGPSAVWQNGGIQSYQWQFVGGGDGFSTIPDPSDSQTGYSMWQGGNLMRWDTRTGESRDVKPPEPEGVKLRFNWNAGLAVDSRDGAVYLGSQFLFRSKDRGETWTAISSDLTTDNPQWQRQEESGGLTPDVSNAENYCTIISIAPSPVKAGVIWAGTDDGRIHVTQDDGKTWASVEANMPGAPRNGWVSHVEASKFDAGTAFVTIDDHRHSDRNPYVYRTDDFGKTWTSLVTGDLRGYAHCLAQDPVQKNLLFMGTEFGLWVSLDGGARWFRWKHGVPPAPVFALEVHPRDHDLVIATHGRALYILDDIRPLRTLSADTMQEPLHLFDTAPAQQHWNRSITSGYSLGAGEFRGQNRAYGAILTYSLNLPGLALPDDKQERERKEAEREARSKEEAPAWGPFAPAKPTPEASPAPEPNAAKPADPNAAKPADPNAAAEPNAPKKAEQAGEEEVKAEIRVLDASGVQVRRFEGPAKLGVNRAVWDLRRDAFKQTPRERPPEEGEEPQGPEVPPGTYTVIVKVRDREARGTVQVLADPRSKNTAQDWQTRWKAILQAGKLQDAMVESIERVRRTRDDVGVIEAKVRDANRELAKTDPKKVDELPVLKAVKKLREGLDKLERKLWVPFDAKGIQPETDALTRVNYVSGYVSSAWAPPSPTHLAYLEQAKKRVQAALDEVNAFYAKDVAEFRKAVEDQKIALLPQEQALSLAP
jgi:photosystem II stability/assembly factor-like uncharacterized protein